MISGQKCRAIKLRMSRNNVGFEFMGKDMLHSKKTEVKEILKF